MLVVIQTTKCLLNYYRNILRIAHYTSISPLIFFLNIFRKIRLRNFLHLAFFALYGDVHVPLIAYRFKKRNEL